MNEEIIIGAGPSGLSYGLFSNNKKIILEKNSAPGGHASSFKLNKFTFDYGPHILFSKDKEILNFIVKTLGKNISLCKRNNKISYKQKLIDFPFENDLGSLDPKDNLECIRDFINNKKKVKNPKNLEEWLLNIFGKSICEKYLFPYNEKVWNIKVKNMSMSWASRIPNPPFIDVLKGSIGIKTPGYLHQLYYHYPKNNGYQSISESWAKRLEVNYNFEVNSIKSKNKRLIVTDKYKKSFSCKRLITTMSIKELIKVLKINIPKKIKKDVSSLIVNPMIIISLGIKGLDKKKYTAIYFPEKSFPVNRISYPCTFSKKNGPKNHYSIQAEITCKKNSKIWKMSKNKIINLVITGLIKKKIIKDKKDIVLTDIKKVKESYVVYDTGFEKKIERIRMWFYTRNIILLGRFSFFEYINVDMAVKRSIEIFKKLNNSNTKKKIILKQVLKKKFHA